jgi:hypothetical protein
VNALDHTQQKLKEQKEGTISSTNTTSFFLFIKCGCFVGSGDFVDENITEESGVNIKKQQFGTKVTHSQSLCVTS